MGRSKQEATERNTRESAVELVDGLTESLKLEPYAVRPGLGMPFGYADAKTGKLSPTQHKYVSWTFDPAVYTTIELLHLTDTQFGHVECQEDRIAEYRDWVLRKPNRFVLLGGDMVDAATVLSPGQPWENVCEPQSQVYRFCELIAPLRPRILGYVGGNHERRGVKTFGDLGVLISRLLRIPYSNGRQLIDIHYGAHRQSAVDRPFQIDLWHGRGASRTDGAKVQMVGNYVKDHPGADLYLTGHLHDCFVFQKFRERRLAASHNVKIRKYYFGMSSSFLNTWGTYAEVSGMSITDVAMIRVILEPSGHSEVTIR